MQYSAAISSSRKYGGGVVRRKPLTETLFWFHNDGEKLYMIPDYWKDMYDFLKSGRDYELRGSSRSKSLPKGKVRSRFPEAQVHWLLYRETKTFVVVITEPSKISKKFYVEPSRTVRFVLVGDKFFIR